MGKNRQYGGMAIIFIGYEKPMFLPKFDTAHHPLFNQCGSNYSGYEQNCTNITKIYAPVWEQRLEEYKKIYDKKLAEDAKEMEEFKRKESEKQKKEMQELERQFNENNKIVAPELEPTEEDIDTASELDFVDDGEEPNFDDVAPITEEILSTYEVTNNVN